MTRSDFGMAPKSFPYWCKGKIIYRKNPISCSVQSTNTLLYYIKIKYIESGFKKTNLEKIIKCRKKTTYNLWIQKKTLNLHTCLVGRLCLFTNKICINH